MGASDDFERGIAEAFNDYFKNSESWKPDCGIAWRETQHMGTDQKVDVLVDAPYLGVEAKSVKSDNTNALYFSQHFSEKSGEHQIHSMDRFLNRAGRKGYLAVLVRNGPGNPLEAYLVDFGLLKLRYVRWKDQEDPEHTGITFDELRDEVHGVKRLPRDDDGNWEITQDVMMWILDAQAQEADSVSEAAQTHIQDG